MPGGASAAASNSSLWTQLHRATAVSELYVNASFFKRNGNSAQVPEEIAMLRNAATGQLGAVSGRRHVRNICEIGFNAGHSAIVWLEGLNTTLKTFDVFRLPYSNASRYHIDRLYPGRVTFYKGRSAETVPRYIRDVRAGVEPLCDVWFVDGDHGHTAPLQDLRNALQAASDGATIIADDCTRRFAAVMHAWHAMLQTGTIHDAFNRTLNLPHPSGLKGWCVGRYANRSSTQRASAR